MNHYEITNTSNCKNHDLPCHQLQMQKEILLQRLKENGYRITQQRQILLNLILEDEFSCCKELYYKATLQDPNIGTATVYRMLNALEEIGAISRRNIYQICCCDK